MNRTLPAKVGEVKIFTHLERGRYRVSVFVDGVFWYSLPATSGSVARVRNRQNSQWSHIAESVTATPIPDSMEIVRPRARRIA